MAKPALRRAFRPLLPFLPPPQAASLSLPLLFLRQEVKNTTVAFLLLKIPTLKIKTAAKKEVFEANLKSECDLWHLMVKEMWAGKKLADDHKVWSRGGPVGTGGTGS